LSEPSEFKAGFRRAAIGWTWHVEKDGEWLIPYDEYSWTPRALTLASAKRKAAQLIRHACAAKDEPSSVPGPELLAWDEARARSEVVP
jgi:hypothetical protein